MIIVNTKNFKTGAPLLKLAKLIEKHDLHTILAVPATDIHNLTIHTSLTIFGQHMYYTSAPTSTGHIIVESIKAAGAQGVLLNHSEHPLESDILKKTVEQCKKAKITSIVCADSLESVKKIAQLRPSAIAFEDPTLINTGKSITQYKSKELAQCIHYLKGKPIVPLCGAGISSIKDVQVAYALGCKGVLIASAIANTKNPEAFIKDLAHWEKEMLA